MNANIGIDLIDEQAVEEAAHSSDVELALHELDLVGGGSIGAVFA